MVTHGICSECGFVIECIDPFGCQRHDFLGRHYDLKDCVKLLLDKLNQMEDIKSMRNIIRIVENEEWKAFNENQRERETI